MPVLYSICCRGLVVFEFGFELCWDLVVLCLYWNYCRDLVVPNFDFRFVAGSSLAQFKVELALGFSCANLVV